MSLVYLNDVPLDDLVYAVCTVDGWRDAIAPQSDLVQLTNYTGGRFSRVAKMSGRTVQIKCDFRPSTVLARKADLDAIAHALQGSVVMRISDALDRVSNVKLRSWQFVSDAGAPLGRGDGTLTLDFESDSAAWIAREPRFVWLSSTPVAVPLGTLPSPYLLRMQGSATNPIVYWRSPLGAVKDQIGFTASLGSTERLELDSRTGLVTYINASNTRTAHLEYWTSGHPPVLDPRDSIPRATQHGMMSVSSGTALLVYWPVYAT